MLQLFLLLTLVFAVAACVITPDQPEVTTEFRRGEIVDLSHTPAYLNPSCMRASSALPGAVAPHPGANGECDRTGSAVCSDPR